MTQTQSRSPAPTATAQDETAGDVSAAAERALVVASGLLSDERARELARLSERWRARRFVTIVAGEFKRGKSTLLNALAGVDLLPTGVLPVTTVPTRVAQGSREAARVLFRDGSRREISLAAIRDYVDESCNPGNRLGVASVEVELAAELPPGVVLVDVPGLGSVHQHNTEAALAALPEADAALVVVSVDPPLGQAELTLLSVLRTHAARVDVVLNKVDYLDDAGRKAAEGFTRDTLERHGFEDVSVWPVSARDGLSARLGGDDVGWRRSGMATLDGSLERFFRHEREETLARSIAGKAARLVAQESALVEMRLAAAERSSESLREIIGQFRSRLATAERDADEARVIFRRRFDAIFAGYAERAAEAWKGPRAAFQSRLGEIRAREGKRSRDAVRETMNAAAREAVEDFLDDFLPAEARRLATAYGHLSAEVGGAAAERAQAVWRLAADLLPFEPPEVEPPPSPPAPRPGGFEIGSLRLMLDQLEDAAARLLTKGAALRRLAAQALEEADAGYGQVVEQSRETSSRAYEEHFASVLAGYDETSKQTALGVENALAAAEERARSLEAERREGAHADELRRAELAVLRESLKRIEGGDHPQSDGGAAGPGGCA
jgi:GTP-binding protein EngB required for normal cell division